MSEPSLQFYGCLLCGIPLRYGDTEGDVPCIKRCQHIPGWLPVANPEFDTPEMRKLMDLKPEV